MTTVTIFTKNPEERVFFEKALRDHADLRFHGVVNHQPAPETEILSVFIDVKVTRQMIESLPKLRLIAVRSTGVDHIDMQAAKEHGVTVANVPGYGSTTVAEYTIALLLMLTRRMSVVLEQSAKGDPSRAAECGIDVFGKTIGLLGTGSIGMGVARIANGLGMNVVAYDPFPRVDAKKYHVDYLTTPEEVLQNSDVVSLHMPLTEATRHFLAKDRLSLMREGSILLNTARGELVDAEALLASLQSGHIRAAGLDVIEPGPYVETLRQMEDVIVTNHNAYNTVEAIDRINQTTAQTIRQFLEG